MNSTESTLIDLSYFPANKLHNDLLDLTTQERRISAEVIEYIAEVDRRKLFAELNYPSLHAYLVECHKYSPAAASRRINAARLLRQIPDLKEKIKVGALSVGQISHVVTAFKQMESEGDTKISLAEKKETLQSLEFKSHRETEKYLADKFNFTAVEFTKVTAKKNDTFEIRLALTKEQFDLIEETKSAVSNSVPTCDVKDLLVYFCEKYQKEIEQKRQKENKSKKASEKSSSIKSEQQSEQNSKKSIQTAETNLVLNEQLSDSARKHSSSSAGTGKRAVSREVKFKLKERAGYQCEWQNPSTAERCRGKSFLEIDHIQPRAWGGGNEVENLRVFCRQHNAAEALQRNLF